MVQTRSSCRKKEEKKKKITKEAQERKNQTSDPPEEIDEFDENGSFIESEFDLYSQEYEIPPSILENPDLKTKSDKIIESLKNDEPSLEKILQLKIRNKRKKELFEWFFIYRYSYPNSEDRILLKKDINTRIDHYKKEFLQFKANKNDFIEMEKLKKDEDNIFFWKKKLLSLQTTEHNKKILFQKCNELDSREYYDEEYYKLLSWFRKSLQLPFDNMISIQHENTTNLLITMKNLLDKELFGMDKVKEQILLYTHNRLLYPSTQSQCLGLIGPPGVGKTSIALCLSKIFQIPFEQIPLGGVSHADFLKGHDYTFVGSKPGSIANSLINMGCKNGIIFFDEFEKVSENKDVVHTLLHITDTSQNFQFKDNFFSELTIDLSQIWFICSMNEKPIDKALADRIFYIEIDGYSFQDKKQIIQNYLLPNALKNIGLNENDIFFHPSSIESLIHKISDDEKGIRQLKQAIQTIISKVAFLFQNQESIPVSFSLPKENYPISYPFQIKPSMISLFLSDFKPKNNHLLNLYI